MQDLAPELKAKLGKAKAEHGGERKSSRQQSQSEFQAQGLLCSTVHWQQGPSALGTRSQELGLCFRGSRSFERAKQTYFGRLDEEK